MKDKTTKKISETGGLVILGICSVGIGGGLWFIIEKVIGWFL